MIEPNQGKIIIETKEGQVYNLHHDLNLRYWREKVVGYCSHDNLIDQGSTGQKQLRNIQEVLDKKVQAQILLFDEADNALDQENKEKFSQKLEELSADNKIIIYVKHEQK
jgi:energy-coupling factor transporter ATP-binding protein EcfA2